MTYQEVYLMDNLTVEAKAIYGMLCSYAGVGATAYPSVEFMCKKLKMSRRRFYTHMNLLIGAGVVKKQSQREDGRRTNNVYVLTPNLQFLPVENVTVENETVGILPVENGTTNNNTINNTITNNNNINNGISSEPDKPAPTGSGILLPLMNGSTYDVPIDKIEMWQQAYLGVNVEQELRKMIAWLNSNPTRKKTARGVDKFINSWLEREQNSGRSYQNTAARELSRPTPAQPSRNHFNNFEQRHHDYDSIVYGQIRDMAKKEKEGNDV